MNGWAILALVLPALFLLGQIRMGGAVQYDQSGPEVRVRVGPIRVLVYPRPKREKPQREKKPEQKGPKKSKKAKPEPETSPPSKGGTLDLIKELLPIALEAAGCFKRKLQVDQLELRLTIGAADPADAALRYGQANALLGAVWRPLTEAFHVVDGRAHVAVDFDAQAPTLFGKAALSLKLGQILRLGLHFGFKALVIFIKYRNQQKKQREAV